MRELLAHVGYPRLYINSIVDRMVVEGFRYGADGEADEELWDWWQANNLDSESKLGFVETLVHGRSYITVSMPDPAMDIGMDPTVPMIRFEPPTSLYAEMDPRTRQVKYAVRPIYSADGNDLLAATIYTIDQIIFFDKIEGEWQPPVAKAHGIGKVPVIPVTNRTRLSDLYGSSEITPEIRSTTDAAAAITMLMRAVAEQMGMPQRLIFGIKDKELGIDPETGEVNFQAYLARILGFSDADGKAMQFAAAELRNFTEVLDELAKQTAAYTGLPPQYLSTSSENPASAEAIRASESRLIMLVEAKNLIVGAALEEAMRIAYLAAKGGNEVPPDMLRMETVWRDPATPTYQAKADAATKLYNGGIGVIPLEQARIDMGYSITQRAQMKQWDEEANTIMQTMGMYGGPGAGTAAAPKPLDPNKPDPASAKKAE